MRLKLTLEYDGAGFRGWAVQPDLRTVEGAVRDALAAVFSSVSVLAVAGRTDTGELTGRGSPLVRGAITGVGTFVGGILHTLPFLIPHYQAAIYSAIAVVALELLILAWLRWKFFEVGFIRALASVTLGGVIIAAVSAALGSAG